MNSKRNADLQRRLSLSQVPRPPAGLGDRIKADIPEYLRPETDRKRLTSSVAFNMRVAASILVVLSSVIGAIYLLGPEEAMTRARSPQLAASADRKSVAPTDELQVEIAQAPPESGTVRLADAASAPREEVAPQRAVEVAASEREDDDRAVVGTLAMGRVVADSVAVVAEAPPVDFAAAVPAPASAPAAVAPEPVAAAAPQVEKKAEMRQMAKLASPSLAREAYAADLDLSPPSSVFGYSIDPSVFNRIKETLEKNERPSASSVNVEAVVNYFAGGPAKIGDREPRIDFEGSPSPLGGMGTGGFLRFTVDTPQSASRLPFAADASVEIEVNEKVVDAISPVGDAALSAGEKALLHNLSVTGLYEVKLKTNLRPTDRVATLRFSYRDLATGARHTSRQSVYVRDFGKLWTAASRRHRLAALGAVWAESLKASWLAEEVVRRADELATQHPRDERARELATAANASSRLPATAF